MTTTKAILLIAAAAMSLAATLHTAMASIVSHTKDSDGVTFTLDKGTMKVKICKDDFVEIKYTTLSDIPSKKSLIITNEWAAPKFDVAESPDEIVIATSRIKIKVSRLTNSIRYTDMNNVTLLAEDGTNGKMMVKDTVAGIITYACETEFMSPADEALFGLGCHPEDSLAMNYKGRNQDLAIKYMTGAIPVLLSTRGYGLM
jgi:alpha-D-xyloside xylohydrolase